MTKSLSLSPFFFFVKQVYSLNVTRFDAPSRRWVPYSSIQDMQLEFTMLDPHIRTGLAPVPGSPGTYSAQFRVPDRHGVFKFVVDYRRKGYVLPFFSFFYFFFLDYKD